MDYFLDHILPLIISAILGCCGFVFQQNFSLKKRLALKDQQLAEAHEKKLNEENARQDARMNDILQGLVSLMRVELIREHDKYCETDKYMPIAAKESMDNVS